MGAVAGIASSIISSAGNAGEKGQVTSDSTTTTAPVASNSGQSGNVSEAADVKDAVTSQPTEVKTDSKKDGGSGMDWAQLARMAGGLMNSGSGSSTPVTAGQISQPSPVANFR